MNFSRVLCRVILLALLSAALVPQAAAWKRGEVQRFAELPVGAANPEGITVARNGDVYVTTFAVTGSPPGRIFVFDPQGRLKQTLEVAGSSNLLLGIAFHPLTDELLVIDFGAAQVLRVDPVSGASSVFTSIGAGAGLNALAFDRAGNVYISDSFRGIVWRTGAAGGAAAAWVSDPLLTTTGFPPFGANGMGFNADESLLFVANTGNDQVIQIPVSGGTPGTPSVFVNAVNGADGLFVDDGGNLWIAANQADEIVVVDPTGKAIAKLGDFDGVRDGAPVGLLFPASLARGGDWVYVTNLALDLRLFGLPQSVDSQWAALVTRHTVSRVRLRFPSP